MPELIFRRGVLRDIPKVVGVDVLPTAFVVTPEHLDAAAHGVEVLRGDVVLIRTGWGRYWGEPAKFIYRSGAQSLVAGLEEALDTLILIGRPPQRPRMTLASTKAIETDSFGRRNSFFCHAKRSRAGDLPKRWVESGLYIAGNSSHLPNAVTNSGRHKAAGSFEARGTGVCYAGTNIAKEIVRERHANEDLKPRPFVTSRIPRSGRPAACEHGQLSV